MKLTVPLVVLAILAIAVVALFLVPETEPTAVTLKNKERTKPAVSVGSGDSSPIDPTLPSYAANTTSSAVENSKSMNEASPQVDTTNWPAEPPLFPVVVGEVREAEGDRDDDPQELGICAVIGDKPIFCSLALFDPQRPLINFKMGDASCAVAFDLAHDQPYLIAADAAASFQQSRDRLLATPVFREQQSGCWWSPLTTMPLRGKPESRMTMVAATIMPASAWRTMHPNTARIELPPGDARGKPVTERRPLNERAKAIVGVLLADQAKHVSISQILDAKLLVSSGGEVVLVLDPDRNQLRAFRTNLNGERLDFYREGEQIVDRQTDSTWDLASGRGTSGPYAGRKLEPVPLFVLPESAWRELHPQSAQF